MVAMPPLASLTSSLLEQAAAEQQLATLIQNALDVEKQRNQEISQASHQYLATHGINSMSAVTTSTAAAATANTNTKQQIQQQQQLIHTHLFAHEWLMAVETKGQESQLVHMHDCQLIARIAATQ
jgi:hypothetical protein